MTKLDELLAELDSAFPMAPIVAKVATAARERIADLEKIACNDWYCVGCDQAWAGPPDAATSRASCPTCGKWMLNKWEHRAEAAEQRAAEAEGLVKVLTDAGKALIDDVRRRYPGEDLRCPFMIALDEAIREPAPAATKDWIVAGDPDPEEPQ